MAWKTSVLVVATVTADSAELLEALRERAAREPTRFTLLAPARRAGRAGREDAERRLEAALAGMRDAGLEVDGFAGDSDPAVAVREAWDPARYDEIVVSTLDTHASKWLLIDLPRRVARMTGVPVAHVVVTEPREPAHGGAAPEPTRFGLMQLSGFGADPVGPPH